MPNDIWNIGNDIVQAFLGAKRLRQLDRDNEIRAMAEINRLVDMLQRREIDTEKAVTERIRTLADLVSQGKLKTEVAPSITIPGASPQPVIGEFALPRQFQFPGFTRESFPLPGGETLPVSTLATPKEMEELLRRSEDIKTKGQLEVQAAKDEAAMARENLRQEGLDARQQKAFEERRDFEKTLHQNRLELERLRTESRERIAAARIKAAIALQNKNLQENAEYIPSLADTYMYTGELKGATQKTVAQVFSYLSQKYPGYVQLSKNVLEKKLPAFAQIGDLIHNIEDFMGTELSNNKLANWAKQKFPLLDSGFTTKLGILQSQLANVSKALSGQTGALSDMDLKLVKDALTNLSAGKTDNLKLLANFKKKYQLAVRSAFLNAPLKQRVEMYKYFGIPLEYTGEDPIKIAVEVYGAKLVE